MSAALSMYVGAGGIKTHFYVEGNGTPVIFVHGGGVGSNASTWLGAMHRVAERRRAFAPDVVGFGKTGAPPIAYSSQRIIEQLTAFLDALCLERVILVGHSLGGTIVARLAVEQPARVIAAVMVAPGGGLVGLTYHSEGHVAQARALDDPTADNIRALAALMRARDDDVEDDFDKRFAFVKAPGHLDALRAYTAARAPSALPEHLPKLSLPLMLMWGARERFNPPEIGDHIARKLPNLKRYVVFDDAGHDIPSDEPARFPKALIDFFDEVEVVR